MFFDLLSLYSRLTCKVVYEQKSSSLTNIFCGVRILRCEGRASEDALLLIRQINFVKLLVQEVG